MLSPVEPRLLLKLKDECSLRNTMHQTEVVWEVKTLRVLFWVAYFEILGNFFEWSCNFFNNIGMKNVRKIVSYSI